MRTDHGAWSEVGKEGGEAVHESAVELARESAGLLDRRRAVAVAAAGHGLAAFRDLEERRGVSALVGGACSLLLLSVYIRVPRSRSVCLCTAR